MIKLPPRPVVRWPGKKPRSAPIPRARDPFVNTPLLPLTPDGKGLDRFWISSFNGAFGSLGVVVDELGGCRLYPFGSFRYAGFYSAAQTGPDTLWLCGNLATMVRLDLRTGRFEAHETGAPAALVFAGMAFDPQSGKLFAAAFPGTRRFTGVVFDARAGRPVKVLDPLDTADHYMRSSIANGDGTYSIQCQCPGLTYMRWDPRDDSLRYDRLAPAVEAHGEGGVLYRTIQDDAGRAYLPGRGWYNGRTGKLEPGIEPACKPGPWSLRGGDWAYGREAGSDAFRRWNLKTGEVQAHGSFPGMNPALTRSGRLVSVSKDGQFQRVIAATGELEMSRFLPTDSVQPADCVIRIDRDRVLGTPFITQRFWEANLRTRRGFDAGPAAPGGGEILRVWNLNRRIYMAAYTGGELMEYDPSRLPRFPENPQVVAKPPTGMRPVASADDGRRIFYACSHHYGHLGSVLTRYDTKTGLALYRDDPLPDQQIVSLCCDKSSNSLLAGTTCDADCASVPARTRDVFLARLDADTLEVQQKALGPEGAGGVGVAGPLGRGKWLATANFGMGIYFSSSASIGWFVLDGGALRTPAKDEIHTLEGWGGRILYAGRPGRFVLQRGARIELWDMNRVKCLKLLADSLHICHFAVQGRDLLLWTAWDVFVMERVLSATQRTTKCTG